MLRWTSGLMQQSSSNRWLSTRSVPFLSLGSGCISTPPAAVSLNTAGLGASDWNHVLGSREEANGKK